MTALSNSATDGEATSPTQLGDSAAPADAELAPAGVPDPDAWRREVAARLARYRARRKPRSPRYPSLLLPFDAPESWSRPAAASVSSPVRAEESHNNPHADCPDRSAHGSADDETGANMGVARHFAEAERARGYDSEPEPSAAVSRGPAVGQLALNVIEFPRSAAIPVFHPSSLADPILDRPRIVEAPEVVPPPPALGGILIEPVEQPAVDRRATADCLVQVAPIPRRMLAMAVDGLIVLTALCAFAAIFLRFNPVRGPLPLLDPSAPTGGAPGTPLLAGIAGAVAALLWIAYQFLFVVYIGATPGLRAARLRLLQFDGSPVSRRTRRWRVLSSFLSAFSAGLGYLWCLLDQDSLCWHDRMSRTYVQARPREE